MQPADLTVPRRATPRVSTLREAANLPWRMLFQGQIRLLLGRDHNISTSVKNGGNLVHLRNFDGHVPLREGIALKLSQTRNLLDAIETIDATAAKSGRRWRGRMLSISCISAKEHSWKYVYSTDYVTTMFGATEDHLRNTTQFIQRLDWTLSLETPECSRSDVHGPTSATWRVGMWLHNARQSIGVASLCWMQFHWP